MCKLEKKASEIDGFGVFTRRTIPAGKEFYIIPLDTIYIFPVPNCARIADNKYVSDNEVLNWVNHSCNPTAILDINRLDPVLIAIRDIKRGEEITVDYNNTEVQGMQIPCTCASENCSGIFNRL